MSQHLKIYLNSLTPLLSHQTEDPSNKKKKIEKWHILWLLEDFTLSWTLNICIFDHKCCK